MDVGDDALLIFNRRACACTPPFIGSRGADVKPHRPGGNAEQQAPPTARRAEQAVVHADDARGPRRAAGAHNAPSLSAAERIDARARRPRPIRRREDPANAAQWYVHENPSRSCSSTRLYPPAPGRSDDDTIIEISAFEGRSVEAKKLLVALLFERLHREAGIARVNVEITITETPRHNWGLRRVSGDELALDYVVEV